MPVITLTISIDIPEGSTVRVEPQAEPLVVAEVPDDGILDESGPATTIRITDQAPPPTLADRVPWTDEEDALAIECQSLADLRDFADMTGRSISAVRSRRYALVGSESKRPKVKTERSMVRWTPLEVDALTPLLTMDPRSDEYRAKLDDLASGLGRTPTAVRAQVKLLRKTA